MGWLQSSTIGLSVPRQLDKLDRRPTHIESKDVHSIWCNTPALKELLITKTKATCLKFISIDENEDPTGLLVRTAVGASVGQLMASLGTMEQEAIQSYGWIYRCNQHGFGYECLRGLELRVDYTVLDEIRHPEELPETNGCQTWCAGKMVF